MKSLHQQGVVRSWKQERFRLDKDQSAALGCRQAGIHQAARSHQRHGGLFDIGHPHRLREAQCDVDRWIDQRVFGDRQGRRQPGVPRLSPSRRYSVECLRRRIEQQVAT